MKPPNRFGVRTVAGRELVVYAETWNQAKPQLIAWCEEQKDPVAQFHGSLGPAASKLEDNTDGRLSA